jgi:hypothetical protein
MARAHALIPTSPWATDREWLALSMDAQWLYLALRTSPEIGNAGVLPLVPQRWASSARDGSLERVEAALLELEDVGRILCDRETQEVCLRTFVQDDGVEKKPTIVIAAQRQYAGIRSERIRELLYHENPHVFRQSEGYPEGYAEGYAEGYRGGYSSTPVRGQEESGHAVGGRAVRGQAAGGQEEGRASANGETDEEFTRELEQSGPVGEMLAKAARRGARRGVVAP